MRPPVDAKPQPWCVPSLTTHGPQSSEDPHVLAQIASWDADLERLIAPKAHTAHVSQIEVELPSARLPLL